MVRMRVDEADRSVRTRTSEDLEAVLRVNLVGGPLATHQSCLPAGGWQAHTPAPCEEHTDRQAERAMLRVLTLAG